MQYEMITMHIYLLLQNMAQDIPDVFLCFVYSLANNRKPRNFV